MRCLSCSRSWDHRRAICCSFLLPFFSFLIFSFSLTLQFLLCCYQRRVGFRCDTWRLIDDIKGTVVFGFGFFSLLSPAKGPVGFASRVMVDLDAGLVGLADIVLVSAVHGTV
jgi:hypothetical protein